MCAAETDSPPSPRPVPTVGLEAGQTWAPTPALVSGRAVVGGGALPACRTPFLQLRLSRIDVSEVRRHRLTLNRQRETVGGFVVTPKAEGDSALKRVRLFLIAAGVAVLLPASASAHVIQVTTPSGTHSQFLGGPGNPGHAGHSHGHVVACLGAEQHSVVNFVGAGC